MTIRIYDLPLRAKAELGGSTSLADHTRHVADCIVVFAERLGFDVGLARTGALLHDLGKVHPRFQIQLLQADKRWNWSAAYRQENWSFIHRHELSSMPFIALFDEQYHMALVEMVVAHHKSIKNDKSKRGLFDLLDEEYDEGDTCTDHLKDWENWNSRALEILAAFGLDVPKYVSKEYAEKAWNDMVQLASEIYKELRWSKWRGLLMAADHFASSEQEDIYKRLPNMFQVPPLSCFDPDRPGGILYPLTDKPIEDPRPNTLVVAPTGAGKTNFLMRRCKGRRVFYILPFQASINAMYERFRQLMPDSDIRLQHSAVRMVLDQQEEIADIDSEESFQGFPGAAIKVLTPHQLASTLLGLPGFEMLLLDLQGAAIVLDEIHTYSDVSKSLVVEMIKLLTRIDCHIHVGTATMPRPLYNEVLNLLGGKGQTYEVSLSDKELQTYNRHIIHKECVNSEEEWLATAARIVHEAMHAEEKVLLVCNTVSRAQKLFKFLEEAAGQYPHMLIHSRFRRMDRATKEEELRNDFNGTGTQAGHRPCWVVSTQVVEVSLDISFDRMLTDCAPIDALIQRFGRINRYRRLENLGVLKPIHVFQPIANQLPYNGELVRKTFEVIPEGVFEETQVQDALDVVYDQLPNNKDIQEHIVWLPDGSFKLHALTNNRSRLLVDLLDIDSVVCILEEDRVEYERGNRDARQKFEIPLRWSYKLKEYPQLSVGSCPYVVPQSVSEHQRLGLVWAEIDQFF